LIAEFGYQAVEETSSELGSLLLTAPESNGDLHLVAFSQELECSSASDLEVVVLNAGRHSQFLDDCAFLVLAGFSFSH
jgi:hypothetical protein